MGKEVVVENNLDYLFLQWLGMDYNFWNVIFAEIILTIGFFVIIFIAGFFVYVFLGGK